MTELFKEIIALLVGRRELVEREEDRQMSAPRRVVLGHKLLHRDGVLTVEAPSYAPVHVLDSLSVASHAGPSALWLVEPSGHNVPGPD